MPIRPQFTFFLSTSDLPVSEKDVIWKTPLPLSRNRVNRYVAKESGIPISHGDYFIAVRSFLMQSRFEILTSAVALHLHRDIRPEEIEEIRIVLEKHGEFYHPARIEVIVDGRVASFVVNVAVSHTGNEYILKEFRLMQRLNTNFPHSFIPNVYEEGEVSVKGGKVSLRMFLGEWFEGFNEFHISKDKRDEKLKLIVWDPDHRNLFLSEDQAKELYSQVAMILTYYYNIETFEQISLWHHAAGDFVVKLQDKRIESKLVTVRQYAPLFENDEAEEKAPEAKVLLEALLIFFLNLTIRTRLDRLNGTGDMVWSDNIAVRGTLNGFFRGLALKAKDGMLPDQFVSFVPSYMACCAESDLFDLLQTIVNTYNPLATDIAVVKKNLKAHSAALYRAIQTDGL